MVSASQTIKQISFREQEDLCTRGQEDSCACNVASGDVFTSEGASGSPGPSSPSQRDRSQRPSFGCGCGNCTFHSYIENGCPHPIPKTSSFPCVDVSGLTPEQKQELRSRLRVESQDIMFKFQQLLSTIYESLRERNICVNRLVTHLLSLGAFDPVSKDSQKPLLKTFFQELQKAESIEDVLWVIRDYFSFFNYHVIEHIVNGLGTAQDRVELQNYKNDFRQYSKRRIYECPPVFGPISDADHTDLVLKVDSAYDQFTVEELDNFEYKLSQIFGVSPQSVLRLCCVEEGCLRLIFQVPSFVQQEIFPLSSEQERALVAEGVIRLTCGDYKFAAKVCILMRSLISVLYDQSLGFNPQDCQPSSISTHTIDQCSHVSSVLPKHLVPTYRLKSARAGECNSEHWQFWPDIWVPSSVTASFSLSSISNHMHH